MTDHTANDDTDRKQARERAAALKEKRKKQKMYLGIGAAVLVFLIWFAMQPLRAGINFGVCRTYLEARMKYPTSFQVTRYDEYGRSLRIFYTYTDAFGGTRSEMAECIAIPDASGGIVMHDIKINRKSINKEELDRFNKTIPGIIAHNPDTIIPRPAGDDLRSLKRD